ncbi:MAG: 16S rRNA (uracil(1498)-N(3))-methyltransferase [Oscillospiraceae bacterium]|nr:16S rRNA (uracil(1498)-N(3))-methyltransferase [Oscillospiraceae bacterium]
MPRFFINGAPGDIYALQGEDFIHLSKSLRMQCGELLTLCNGKGLDFICSVQSIEPQQAILKVLETQPNKAEPDIKVTLFQCLPKGDKLDTVIQKAVELGVFELVPVISSRVISRPDAKALDKKRQRWQKVALEAAKQSGRGIVPQIKECLSLKEMCKQLPSFEQALFCYEKGGAPVKSVLEEEKPHALAVIIGPEGGFAPEEAELIQSSGGTAVTLGTRILRTETAPLAVLSIIMYQTGNI